MTCRDICDRYKAEKPTFGGRYVTSQRRCQICEKFITWEGLWCPCCSYRLRTKPRNIKYKAKLRAQEQADNEAIECTVKKGDKVDAYERDEDGMMVYCGQATLIEEIRAEGKYRLWRVILKKKTCERFILAK